MLNLDKALPDFKYTQEKERSGNKRRKMSWFENKEAVLWKEKKKKDVSVRWSSSTRDVKSSSYQKEVRICTRIHTNA